MSPVAQTTGQCSDADRRSEGCPRGVVLLAERFGCAGGGQCGDGDAAGCRAGPAARSRPSPTAGGTAGTTRTSPIAATPASTAGSFRWRRGLHHAGTGRTNETGTAAVAAGFRFETAAHADGALTTLADQTLAAIGVGGAPQTSGGTPGSLTETTLAGEG